MQNLSDNDIDKLFIQAAGENQPPFDPADWSAMEKKLDKHYRFPYLKWFSGLLLLGIVSTSVWIGYTKWDDKTGSSSVTELHEKTLESQTITPSTLPDPEDSRIEAGTNTTSLVDNTLRTKRKESSSTPDHQIVAYTKNTASIREVIRGEERDVNSFSSTVDITTKSELTNPSTQTKRNAGILATDTLTRTELLADSTTEKQTTESKSEQKENEEKTFHRLAVRVMASPDYTSDRFKEAGKTGFNYGIDIHYFISPHISVSAGALRSRKYYTAEGAEYGGVEAEDLSGDCYMWDIPINIRYTLAPNRKFTGFISTGLTSYLLSDETYSFQVETGYGDRQQYTMNVKNGNNEWFSALNVSLGIQQRVSNHFALQLEPFAKIPLAEIGEGNIQLSSMGCFFAVQYSFGKKSK